MEVILRPDARAAADLVARVVGDRLAKKPALVLGLATGRTMEAVYERLIELFRAGQASFAACSAFALDEYIGLAADDERSYRHYLMTRLVRRVDLPPERLRTLDGTATDLAAEAARYEDLIRRAGGIDLQLLGLGRAGHIGFNEPLSALMSRTREKALSPITLRQNAEHFGGDPERVPRRALTMGVGTILEARELLLLVTGAAKAEVLARAVEGPITSMVSATALQLHPRCTVVVDEEAAARLEQREYYRWIFAHEPEWSRFRDADA